MESDENLIEKLREAYAEIEGISGDVQGGAIEIYTMDDVKNWKSNVRDVIEAWNKLKG